MIFVILSIIIVLNAMLIALLISLNKTLKNVCDINLENYEILTNILNIESKLFMADRIRFSKDFGKDINTVYKKYTDGLVEKINMEDEGESLDSFSDAEGSLH